MSGFSVPRSWFLFVLNIFKHIYTWVRGLFVNRLYPWFVNLLRALTNLWRAVGPHWLRVALIACLVAVFGFHKLKQYLQPKLTHETIHKLVYLNNGWTEQQRQSFYYTPQGTELLGLRYDWFINLELPLSTERFASAENMRGWGFIVAPGQRPSSINPGNLPVGLGRHIDPVSGEENLDIGCATCHTGELHYKGVAMRVDGGQAVQSIPNARRGEFITTLGAAVFETLLNPAKWDRFATRLVGNDKKARDALNESLWAFAKKLRGFSATAGAKKYSPVEEGRGRTDAVGRIGNVVFGFDLDEPDNYHPADAPASYPFIWDIWRFDWVQYTGFTNQAMARNMGESLGVLAPIKLVDAKGKLLSGEAFAQSLVDIDGLHCAEGLLRTLKPPKWPEAILGEINLTKARAGKQLFADHCQQCHGPHITEPYLWPIADEKHPEMAGQIAVNWQWDMAGDVLEKNGRYFRKDWRTKMWAIPWVDIDTIATDTKLADNFLNNKYNAKKLLADAPPVSAGQGLQVLLNELVPLSYRRWDVTGEKVAAYDGLNVPFRIENKRAYKSRPLHGVWATPPFLHNGSVPTIYHLLSSLAERPKTFYVGNREYDPQHLGYTTEFHSGSFKLDTTISGNHNSGHLFTDTDMPGRIGPRFSEQQKYQLLEYLKIMGNPDFSDVLEGDPQNWAQYTAPPPSDWSDAACNNSHLRHAVSFSRTTSGAEI